MKKLRVLHISDWHGELPDFFDELQRLSFDILISTGDMLLNEFPKSKGYNEIKDSEVKFQKIHINEVYGSKFVSWLKEKKSRVLCVDGNHDFISFNDYLKANDINSTELKANEITKIGDFNFSGHPYIPFCGNIWNHEKSESEISNLMKDFPKEAEILVSHVPPYGILDDSKKYGPLGSKAMSDFLKKNSRVKINLFGHSHDKFGSYENERQFFSNAATGARLLELSKKPNDKKIEIKTIFSKRK